MEKKPHNPKCVLSDTHYCDVLNMHSCDRCTIGGQGDTPEQVMHDIDLYEELLPEGGIAQLFLSRQCQFCRVEPKGERQGYAILDMAHPEPKRIQRRLLGKRVSPIGTMVPLQFSICEHCRRRLLLIDYLPLLVPVALGIVGLLLLSLDQVQTALSDAASYLPFVSWIALLLVGALIGKAASKAAAKNAEKTMYANVLEHPVVQEMLQKGWFPIARESRTRVMFSKSRRVRGLGTAVPEEEESH